MEYFIGVLVLAGVVYGVVRWRSRGGSERRPCPKCGGELQFRERHFRGASVEHFWECDNVECGHRQGV